MSEKSGSIPTKKVESSTDSIPQEINDVRNMIIDMMKNKASTIDKFATLEKVFANTEKILKKLPGKK